VENTKNPQFLIYALWHPNSKRVYVGKSSKGMRRPMAHGEPANLRQYAHLPRAKWITSLRKRGLEPKIAVLEVCASADDLNEAERFYISAFKAQGTPLLNLTDGGDGVLGHKFTEAALAKMSATRKKRMAETPGERERIAQMSRDYWATPEARAKKSAERMGVGWTDETRVKMVAALTGKPKSAKHRAALSGASVKKWTAPGYREKQIKAQREAHSTPEAKAQAAEWAKRASHDTHRSPEYREKQSARAKAACASKEVRERKSAAATLKAQDPAYIKKLSDARKLWWAERKKNKPKDDPK